MQKPGIRAKVLGWIRPGRVSVVWVATPCSAFSVARRGIRNYPAAIEKDAEAASHAWFTAELVFECLRSQVAFVIENPASSRLWQLPPLRHALGSSREGEVKSVLFDACQYGSPWKKPTQLVGALPGIERLGARCDGHHDHERLRGKAKVGRGGSSSCVSRTSLGAAYSPLLANAVVQVIRAHLMSRRVGGAKRPRCALFARASRRGMFRWHEAGAACCSLPPTRGERERRVASAVGSLGRGRVAEASCVSAGRSATSRPAWRPRAGGAKQT